MKVRHQPVVFACEGEELVGVIECPSDPQDIGVIIVTGGPQYRAGSHRQFVSITRSLALNGYPAMRFDHRGMGDSGGSETPFFDTAPDLCAAIDTFMANTHVRRVVLWGLCDAASAILIYAYRDDRVAGLILLNPWVRTDEGLAQAYVKTYYLGRVLTREFWTKVLSGEIEWRKSAGELARNLVSTMGLVLRSRNIEGTRSDSEFPDDFRDRMRQGAERYYGAILYLLCGNDLTASEFLNFTKRSKAWRKVMARDSVRQVVLPNMDHTFSTAAWRREIVANTLIWLSSAAYIARASV